MQYIPLPWGCTCLVRAALLWPLCKLHTFAVLNRQREAHPDLSAKTVLSVRNGLTRDARFLGAIWQGLAASSPPWH